MSRIFKRPDAKSFIAEFKDARGVWRRRSTNTTDRKAAEAALRRFEREANGVDGATGLPANQAAHALGDAVDWLVRNALSLGKSPGTLRMWHQKAGHLVGSWPNARRDLAEACVRAGIERVSPNDLRRTFASWMKQAGADSAVVAKLLGHASTRMVDLVYGKLDEATLLRAIGSLPGGRAVSGLKQGAFGEHGEQIQPTAAAENPSDAEEESVLGPGIEPGTRGFSIRSSSTEDARLARRWKLSPRRWEARGKARIGQARRR